MSGLQFDGDDTNEVELAGSLCSTEVPVSKDRALRWLAGWALWQLAGQAL